MLAGVTLARVEGVLAGKEISKEEGDCRLVPSTTMLNMLAGWLVSESSHSPHQQRFFK